MNFRKLEAQFVSYDHITTSMFVELTMTDEIFNSKITTCKKQKSFHSTNNSTQNHNPQFKIKHPYFTSIISFLIFILQSFTDSNHFKFKIKLFYIFFIILLNSFIKVLIFISYLCYNMVTKRLID